MRSTVVLAATLVSLLTSAAVAEVPVGQPPAKSAPAGQPPAPPAATGQPATQPPPAGQASAQPVPAELTPPVATPKTAARTIRQQMAWRRRVKARTRARQQAQAHKLGNLTLPSFDMTAPFTQGRLTLPTADTASAAPSAPSGTPQANQAAPIMPVQAQALTPPPRPGAQPVPADTRLAPRPATPPPATWIEPVAAMAEPTILLRTDPDVGLAAFRAGPEMLVVLDAPINFRAPAVGLDPVFAQLDSQRTQDATVIRIPMPLGTLRLARTARGWLVTEGSPPDSITAIVPRLIKSGPVTASIQFPASDPSRVVTVVNPQTGDRLLVGTQGLPGQAVPTPWQQAKFGLMPTLQGVVVAAISDDIRFGRDTGGFTLTTGPQADSTIIQDADRQTSNTPIAGAISRLFDIPNGTAADLARELDKRIQAAGDAHALARSEPRLRVAEVMIALGMDVEAQSVIDVALAADPALLDKPRAIGLRAVAATLAGRFDEARPLTDPRLTGSTEIELWRAFLNASQDQPTAGDAHSLSAGLPLVLAYPPTLRDRLLPTALETMALHGQAEAAQAILKTLPNDRTLDLARAMVLEMTNQPAGALQAYDQVAKSSDRLRRYTAEVRAAELRIKSGQLDARAGADVLDRALLGWRGPSQELALRTRIAALRRQVGQWREALTVLRDGRNAFPEDHAQMDRELADTFAAFIADDAVRNLSPSAFVALYDANADLVRDIAWTPRTGTALVDRLVGLGLQGRAEPILMRLVVQSTDPARRAGLGERLADLRMTMNAPDSAFAALAETAPPADVAINPAMMEARQLLYAHAESERGNKDTALTMLSALGTAKADAARADIYAARKDWPHTLAALTDWEQKAISTSDLTEDQQAMVARIAVAATLSEDAATLTRVAAKYGTAMAKGRSSGLFRLLTSAPVQDKDDLPRAFAEIQLARQVQGSLDATVSP